MKKKDKIKALELQVHCLSALLAEYVIKEAIRRIHVPDYKKGCKENLAIVNDAKKENFFVVYPNGNKEQISPPINFEKDGNYCFVKDENIETDIEKYFKYLSEQQKQAKEQ